MNAPDPAVTVVIPCYNLGAYLDQAVQSVLDQAFQDFEIIIIDDGSTDPATRHLFTSYQRPRTRILRTENRGLAEARNLGIREAKGRYICCLDADDLLEPAFLLRTFAVLESYPSAAFASCWLKAFGDNEFSWNPATCDFPHLLAEDTVCTAALTRKDAILQAGGFDPRMPVAGYEDWDLAISLVELGLRGVIIPEVLFRYRIRSGSMSGSCTSPGNHALLMRYIVEKHGKSYRNHLPGVLETIEKRTAELERHRPGQPAAAHPEEQARIDRLETFLRGVLESRNWTASRPLRLAYGLVKRLRRAGRFTGNEPPGISVIVTCRNQGVELAGALEGIRRHIGGRAEVVIVDDGSTDPIARQVLDWFYEAGFEVIRTKGAGPHGARAAGLRKARAPVVFAMDAGETVEPGSLLKALEILENDAGTAFVLGGLRDEGTGFTWLPESAATPGLLACPRLAFPVVRRAAMLQAGGYDVNLLHPLQADWDLSVRLAERGEKGVVLSEPLVRRAFRPPPGPLVAPLYAKHRGVFQQYGAEAVLGHEYRRRALQACFEKTAAQPPDKGPAPVEWGGLRRLEPVSPVWGLDRGQPMDRYYIGRFLDRHRQDIRGRVLEVKDSGYTLKYGQDLEKADVLDIAADNPSVTLVADLEAQDSLPENVYDCFILTQTIHIIYRTAQVLENAARALKPGGVLLATLPCVSRVDYESGLKGDCWRFTPAAASRLVEDAFGAGNVEVEAFGNVLVCCGFLLGIAAGELTDAELEHQDPYFPLLVCVRAVKKSAAPTRRLSDEKLLRSLLAKDEEVSALLRTNYDLERILMKDAEER